MRIDRALAAFFVAASLVLATLLTLGASGRTAIAAASTCGEYSGPLCSQTTTCKFLIFFCSTEYDYYKSGEDDGGGSLPQPEPEPEPEPS